MDLKLVFIVVCCLYINADASKSRDHAMDLKLYMLFVYVVVWCTGSPNDQCEYDCQCMRYEVHCANGKDHYTKYEAQQFCESRGGTLANLKTEEVDENVRQFIIDQDLDNQTCVNDWGFWIALNDVEEEGTFVWGDGEVIDDNSYTNWANGQPDNNTDKDPINGQDCVQLWFRFNNNLQWDDDYCLERANGMVCEIPVGDS
ncbi:C-type lectin mosGCTL-1-like [Glandiceps talaboti]